MNRIGRKQEDNIVQYYGHGESDNMFDESSQPSKENLKEIESAEVFDYSDTNEFFGGFGRCGDS